VQQDRTTERERFTPRGSALHYAQGLLMGGADVIPGVSGGTVALIVGIYERLVGSIRSAATAPVSLLRGDVRRAQAHLQEVHWSLIVPLLAGIITALLLGAKVIPELLETYPVQMRGLFFGLIAGSLPIPWRRIRQVRPVHIVTAVIAALAALVLSGLPPQEVHNPTLPVVFGAAAIAICAMILPGISGSFLLLVMGMYTPTLRALHGRDMPYVIVFVLGCAIGLGLFSKVLEYLLEHWHDVTMAALVGLMAGSLRALWPWLTEERTMLAPVADSTLPVVLLLAVLGVVAVLLLAHIGDRAERAAAGR
jgi:putative membrane protein